MADSIPASPPEKKRIFCNNCRRETNHLLKGSHRTFLRDDDDGYAEELVNSLYICAGCEWATLEERYAMAQFIEEDADLDLEFGHFYYTYHPERNPGALERQPKTFTKLKPRIARIYLEAIKCFNNGCHVMCAAGLRAVLEAICRDKRVAGSDLYHRINNLEFLLPNKLLIKRLHHFRIIGNDALHDMSAPKSEDLALVFDVLESLLDFLYELDFKASRLKTKRGRRKRQPKVKVATAGAPSSGASVN